MLDIFLTVHMCTFAGRPYVLYDVYFRPYLQDNFPVYKEKKFEIEKFD